MRPAATMRVSTLRAENTISGPQSTNEDTDVRVYRCRFCDDPQNGLHTPAKSTRRGCQRLADDASCYETYGNVSLFLSYGRT
jgi:hypothetical protein